MFLVQLVAGPKKITINLDKVAYITDKYIEFVDESQFLAITADMHEQLLEAAFGRGRGPIQVTGPERWSFGEERS